jgi:hypothetical protein
MLPRVAGFLEERLLKTCWLLRSPWALGIVMALKRKASGSNLALGITIVLTRDTYALPFV